MQHNPALSPLSVTPRSHEQLARSVEFLEVIVKITERCNLACSYCYFFFAGDESYKEHPPFMREGTVFELIEFLKRVKKDSGATHMRIGLHGGEPLLLKKSAFIEMCSLLRSEFGPDPILALTLQTNGVLVDEEWVALFARFRVRLGVSLDGPQELNDVGRINKKGKGTYAETVRGWKLLKSAARRGEISEPGILCVVTPGADGGAILRHFAEDLDARYVSFLLPDFTHDAVAFNNKVIKQCTQFMLSVAEAWFDLDKASVNVRFLDDAIGVMLDDRLAEKASTRQNPYRQISVSSNGEICPDDVIRSYADRFASTGQTIADSDFETMVRHPAWSELAAAAAQLPSTCSACVWKKVCGGGLLQHRFSRSKGFDNPSIYCSAYKDLNSYIAARLISSGVPHDAIERRLAAL